MTSSSSVGNLRQLTALRFFAAFAVLLSHLTFLKDGDNLLTGFARTIFSEGFSGVAFFFILSGYILSHSYHQKLGRGEVSPTNFFLLRLARIYPLHFLTAVPFIAISIHEAGLSVVPKSAVNLSLLQSWIPYGNFYYSFNSVSWSLSNELFFYLCFIFLTTLSTGELGKTAFAWLLAILCTALICVLIGHSSWEHKRVHYLSYIFPATRLLDFMLGMLIWRLSVSSPVKGGNIHEISSVVMLVASMYLFSSREVPDVLRSQLIYLPVMGYVVWSFSAGQGFLSGAISRPSLVLLGESSFALYMVHQPIVHQGFAAYSRYRPEFDYVTLALILTVVSILVSVVVYRYVEKPIQSRLRTLIGKA